MTNRPRKREDYEKPESETEELRRQIADYKKRMAKMERRLKKMKEENAELKDDRELLMATIAELEETMEIVVEQEEIDVAALTFTNMLNWCKKQIKYDDVKPVIVMLQSLIGCSGCENTSDYFNEIEKVINFFRNRELERYTQPIIYNYGQYNRAVDRQDNHLPAPNNNKLIG